MARMEELNRRRVLAEKSSNRASKLHTIKNKAGEIRKLHSEGKLTAEEAAAKLQALHTTRKYGVLTFRPYVKATA